MAEGNFRHVREFQYSGGKFKGDPERDNLDQSVTVTLHFFHRDFVSVTNKKLSYTAEIARVGGHYTPLKSLNVTEFSTD